MAAVASVLCKAVIRTGIGAPIIGDGELVFHLSQLIAQIGAAG